MTNDRETWLQSIRSNPSDWQAMLVFADWLEEEQGDLLAAEQWRFLSVTCGARVEEINMPMVGLVKSWPECIFYLLDKNGNGVRKRTDELWSWERDFAVTHNIRCMPRYPLTIEDVQSYFSQLESVDSR